MNAVSPSDVKEWCIGGGFHPNRNLGQNFLVDRNVRDAIVAAAGLHPGDRALEIGPGLGSLTMGLLAAGVSVYAIEKDTRLASRLAEAWDDEIKQLMFTEHFSHAPGSLDLHAGDALETDWDALFSFPFDAMVSNLPYSVGTRILLDAAAHPSAPERIVVLVQNEVAERFAARENEDARGQVGVWLQLDYEVSVLFQVKPNCFWPRPEVDSAVVRLDRRSVVLDPVVRDRCRALSKYSFMHRRKQIGTILRKAPFATDVDTSAALQRAGIEAAARPETLSNERWVALAEAWRA